MSDIRIELQTQPPLVRVTGMTQDEFKALILEMGSIQLMDAASPLATIRRLLLETVADRAIRSSW